VWRAHVDRAPIATVMSGLHLSSDVHVGETALAIDAVARVLS